MRASASAIFGTLLFLLPMLLLAANNTTLEHADGEIKQTQVSPGTVVQAHGLDWKLSGPIDTVDGKVWLGETTDLRFSGTNGGGITAGDDGGMFFTQTLGGPNFLSASKLGINQTNTTILLDSSDGGTHSFTHAMAATGPDGTIWIAAESSYGLILYSYTTENGIVQTQGYGTMVMDYYMNLVVRNDGIVILTGASSAGSTSTLYIYAFKPDGSVLQDHSINIQSVSTEEKKNLELDANGNLWLCYLNGSTHPTSHFLSVAMLPNSWNGIGDQTWFTETVPRGNIPSSEGYGEGCSIDSFSSGQIIVTSTVKQNSGEFSGEQFFSTRAVNGSWTMEMPFIGTTDSFDYLYKFILVDKHDQIWMPMYVAEDVAYLYFRNQQGEWSRISWIRLFFRFSKQSLVEL